MAITPLSTRNFLAVRPMSSSPSTSPVFTIHRVVKDAADPASITDRALGMNMHGYKTGMIKVVPSASANPNIEVLFWSGEAGKFISRVHAVESGGFGDGVAFDLPFKAFGGIAFVKVKSGIGSGDTVTITMAGSQRQAAESDVLLHFSDINYTGDGGYLRNPFTDELLGPFASNNLPQFIHEGRRYACPFEARTNKADYSQAIDQWTNPGAGCIITPDDAIAPDGTLTADKMELDGPTAYSRYYLIPQGDVLERWSAGLWIKAADAPSIGKTFRFSVNGVVDLKVTGTLTERWKYFSASDDVKGINLTIAYVNLADEPDPGDPALPAYKAHVWGHMIEHANFPSAYYIPTPGTDDVARAKDRLLWAGALVPAAIRTGKFGLKTVPFGASGETTVADHHWHIDDTSERIAARMYTLPLVVEEIGGDATEYIRTADMGWSRNVLTTNIYDVAGGAVTLSGYDSGNDVYTDTPWSTDDGDLDWGHNRGANQLNGLICEPYRPIP